MTRQETLLGRGKGPLAAAWVLGGIVGSGVAAAAGADGAVESDSLEEITVTAQRKVESVLQVPSSIEVFNERAIEGLGITDIQDIARLTPGLYSAPSSTSTNTTNITIRGIGSDISSPSTAIYINDTPIQVRAIGDAQAADSAYPLVFDLERVEVLRGPQGTLFGSSAEGGAVRFITRDPGPEWEGHVLAEGSQVEHGGLGYQAGVAGGGPLTDSLGFRGSVYAQKIGGWVDFRPLTTHLIGNENFPNRDDANSSDNLAASLALAWKLTDRLTITPSVMFQKQKMNGESRVWRDYSAGRNDVNRNLFPARVNNKFVLTSIGAQWKLDLFDVYSTTSYLDRKRDAGSDLSFGFTGFFGGDINSPVSQVLFDTRNPQQQFSQEVRLQGVSFDDRLSWVGGAFYRDLKQQAYFAEVAPHFDDLLISYFGAPASVIFGSDLIDGTISELQHDTSRDTELAGFGQLDFKVAPGWTLTAGMRAVRTKNEASIDREGPLQGTPGVVSANASSTQSVWLPKVGLKYEPDKNWMLYATASRGFRPGGANTTPALGLCDSGLAQLGLKDVPGDYRADYLNSYEVGVKGSTSDGRFSLATSVYRSDWKDRQDAVSLGTCGLNYIDNLGAAVSQGVEVQFMAAVLEGLKFSLSGAYNDSYFKDSIVIGSVPVVTAGDQLDMPPRMVAAAVDYTFPAFAASKAYVHFDGQYASGHTVRVGADLNYPPSADRPSSLIAAGRVGLKFGEWDVSLFASNLFDTRRFIRTNEVAGEPIDTRPQPRVFGLTVRNKF